MDNKKVILSGIQPSGILTIGNYLGAIKNWGVMQDEYDCVYMLADLHTLTVKQEPAKLRANTYELISLYLACGLDPVKSVLFLQSHVHQHFSAPCSRSSLSSSAKALPIAIEATTMQIQISTAKTFLPVVFFFCDFGG